MPERLPRLGDRHADGFREDDRPAHGGLLSLRLQRAESVAADEDRCIKDSLYPVNTERGEVHGGDEPRRDVPNGPRDRRVPKGSRQHIAGKDWRADRRCLRQPRQAAMAAPPPARVRMVWSRKTVALGRDPAFVAGGGSQWDEAARLSKGAARRGSGSGTAEV